MAKILKLSLFFTTDNKIMNERVRYSLPPACENHPWLIFSHGEDKQRQTFFNISENHYYIKIIPELLNKQVVCCSNKWLVLKDFDSNDYFLLNLVSMENIQLPPIEDLEYRAYILWVGPNDPNCHLLFVSDYFLLSWQSGDDEFVRKIFNTETGFNGFTYVDSIIVHQKKIYAITDPHSDILVADFEEPIVRFTKLINNKGPVPIMQGMPSYKMYLIEFGDELLLVNKILSLRFEHQGMILDFEIYRLDRLKETWVKVKNIGKRTIFLSKTEGKCCLVSNIGIKENSIYFTRNRNLYVFDLDDRSTTVSLPCPIVSKKYSYVNWIW